MYKCDYSKGFSCVPSGALLAPGCNALRVAERAGLLSHVAQVGKLLTVDDVHTLAAPVFGSSFDVVATRDLFHVVYAATDEAGTASAIVVASYDPASASTPVAVQYLPQGGGDVLSVDVFADGPDQTGYAIVYTEIDSVSVTNVRFMHLCQ
jgi:hypothetical protein